MSKYCFNEGISSDLEAGVRKIRAKIPYILLTLFFLFMISLSIYWSIEPDLFSVQDNANQMSELQGKEIVTGYTTAVTLHKIANTLLTKPGGYLRNDVMPPSVFLDNMPSWELGVLIQVRDMARALRRDFSRSQSQSKEDRDLVIAEPQFNFNAKSWMMPSSEKEYQRGIDKLESFISRLPDKDDPAQFYARADNLARWLGDVETRLGSLSMRLSASVGKTHLDTDLSGDKTASQSTKTDDAALIKTPWSEIDDIFYEARGASWALVHLLRAIEIDFSSVLKKKNALVSMKQIIRELEATQDTVWSPMILNGDGFGLLANHSLVMANYISRSHASIIDLRRLLEKG